MADVPLMSTSAAPPAAVEVSFESQTAQLQILKRDIPWESYFSAKLITPSDFQLLRRYDHKSREMQAGLLEESGPAYVKTFLSVLRNVFKEETAEYVLALIHSLLADDRRRLQFFFEANMTAAEIFDPLLRLLSSRNWYILEGTTKLLSQLIAQSVTAKSLSGGTTRSASSSSAAGPPGNGKGPAAEESSVDTKPVLESFVPWLSDQLVSPAHPTRGIQTAVSGLAAVLRAGSARGVFVRSDGIPRLLPLISPVSSQTQMQLLYDAVLCLWLLSFNDSALEALKPTRAAKALSDVARTSSKEKIVRVAVLALNNLMLRGNMGATMVELGLPKIIQSLKLQTWHDEDLKDALESLQEGLRHNLKVMSSFDKYKQEVLSGALEWSPMHKDAQFWRENIMRFEENEFQILRTLVGLLGVSQEKRTLAVACHDLGMFITSHPSGRNIALDLKAKERVIMLMEDDDPDVRKQALLCIQKLLLSAKYVSYLKA